MSLTRWGLALAALYPAVAVASSVGARYTGSTDYASFGLTGDLDLDEKTTWDGTLTYERVSSDQGGQPSKSNLFGVDFAHEPDDGNRVTFGAAYWNDTVNNLIYRGPRGGYTRTWEEYFAATIDADLFVYTAYFATPGTAGATGRRGRAANGDNASISTTQFRPTLDLERPFWHERVTPTLTLSHGFYSRDPSDLTAGLSQRSLHFNPNLSNQIDIMTGGFIRNLWITGLELAIPALEKPLRARFEYGQSQSAVDGAWSPDYGVSLTQVFVEQWKAKLQWAHSIQTGITADYYTVALTYLF